MTAPYLVDAHCHLHDSRLGDSNVDRVMERARQEGIRLLVVNAAREEEWEKVCALARRWREVIPALGVHPWHAAAARPGWNQRLLAACRATGASVGECGLDRPCRVAPAVQEEVFLHHLEIATRLGRTVSIHCVRRWGRLCEHLAAADSGAMTPVIHSFGGSVEILERLLAAGAYISFSGRLAAPEADKIRAAFDRTPLDRLLLETDAPDQWSAELAADSHLDGPLNEPAQVAALYAFAARRRKMDLDEFTTRLYENAQIFTN